MDKRLQLAKIASSTQKEKVVSDILAHLNIRVTWPLQPRCERSWSWDRLQSAFPPRSSSKMCYSKSSSILFQQAIQGFLSAPPGLWREVDLLSRATRWSWKDFGVTNEGLTSLQHDQWQIYNIHHTNNTCCWSVIGSTGKKNQSSPSCELHLFHRCLSTASVSEVSPMWTFDQNNQI